MRSPLTRRALLRAGLLAGASGLAGCGAGERRSPGTTDAAAGGQNTTPRPTRPPSTGSTADGPGGGTSGSPAGAKPTTLPARASLDLYAADSPLNTPVPVDAPLDPESAGYVGLLAETAAAGDFVIELDAYSSTVFIADADTPRHDVQLGCGPTWEMGVSVLRDVPIPTFAEPARDPVDDAPIPPGGCGEDAEPDDQLVVIDLETRCEYDFWQMRRDGDRWIASWGNSIGLDGPGIYPRGLSARGSGFSTLSGLIWPSELAAGRIEHALVFSYPHPAAGGPVAPATESDGVSTRRYALPEGARLRLDPDLDLGSLDLAPYELTVGRALQEYGMFLVDRGGAGAGGEATGDGGVSTEAVDPASVQGNPYDGLLPDVPFPSLGGLPLDRLQVLELGPQDSRANAETALVPSGCARFE